MTDMFMGKSGKEKRLKTESAPASEKFAQTIAKTKQDLTDTKPPLLGGKSPTNCLGI